MPACVLFRAAIARGVLPPVMLAEVPAGSLAARASRYRGAGLPRPIPPGTAHVLPYVVSAPATRRARALAALRGNARLSPGLTNLHQEACQRIRLTLLIFGQIARTGYRPLSRHPGRRFIAGNEGVDTVTAAAPAREPGG